MSITHERAGPARDLNNQSTDPFMHDLIAARASLHRYALNLCRNPDDAEDAVQTTLYRAIRDQPRFTPGTSLMAWLKTILRRALNDERKHAKTGRSIFIDIRAADLAAEDEPVAADNPERAMIVQEALEAIAKKLKPLTADILMGAGIGCTLEAMAEEFGLPINSIKSHLRRGRAQLVAATGRVA